MVTTRLLTADDLWAIPDEERGELIDGEMQPVTPRTLSQGIVVGRLGDRLSVWAEATGYGMVAVDAGFIFRRDPDTVLGPDLAVMNRAAVAGASNRGFAETAPMLAVEVLSPANPPRDVARKIAIYLEAGVALVWVVDLKRRTVSVHEPNREPRTLIGDDVLEGGATLPGFAVALGYLFG